MSRSLLLNEIKPRGWMYQQMKRDLTEGFVGCLDELVPGLIQEDDIYDKDRLSKNFKVKNLGVAEDEVEGSLQLQWWNSETQSNWYDGFIRHVVLLEDTTYAFKLEKYIRKMLEAQDENGYMGIYAEDLRYQFDFEGGELWAQSTLFRALLGYYEATKKEEILVAVRKAVEVTMKAYPVGKSHPFKYEQSHGLTLIDTLLVLYDLTEDERYTDYAVWLYDNFSEEEVLEKDAQLSYLMNNEYRFMEHGVHTYEHLRGVTAAYYITRSEKYRIALESYLAKLEDCLCPSGAPIGDEWIRGRVANPDRTGYEYCSIQELLHAYALLLQCSGDLKWADRIEWLLFNAGQGARHPRESAVAYLKSDNSYSMLGDFQFEQENCPHKVQTRYKYSPVHQDAAVCCVPNAGRIYPYYIKHMWMESERGFEKCLYGPSTMTTRFKGNELTIIEETDYPFENTIRFKIMLSAPQRIEISFRKPNWCQKIVVKSNKAYIETEDKITFNEVWNLDNTVELEFKYKVIVHESKQEEYYLSYGPLVYALPIEAEEIKGKSYLEGKFYDLYYKPTNDQYNDWVINKQLLKEIQAVDALNKKDSDSLCKHGLKLTLYNIQTHQNEEQSLVPMGNTLLRKVTFKAI